jgi:branched-chain amino acid transport system permease protein
VTAEARVRLAAAPPRLERLRTPALLLGGSLGVLLVTQLLPATDAGSGGTPAAILFGGLVAGMVSALSAAGLVLIYRTTRIINFAHTAMGAAGAVFCFELIQLTPVPFPVAFLLGVVTSAAIGVAFDLVFGRRFIRAPRLVLTVLTIVAAQALGQQSVRLVASLPIFPPLGSRTLSELTGAQSLGPLLPFNTFSFKVFDYPLPFHFADLFALSMAAILLTALGAWLQFSRTGVAVRAMAENGERAALLGISVGLLSSIVWAVAGGLAGAGVTLTGLLASPAAAEGVAPAVLLPALAAAVVGRMRGLWVTTVTAVGISVLTAALRYRFPTQLPLLDLGLFLVIAAGLLAQRRGRGRSEEGVTQAWQSSEEARPIPRELMALTGVRLARWGLMALGVAAVAVFPFLTSPEQMNLAGVVALDAIVGISLVVLTGWAGQVSLGQFAFAAIGAVVGGGLASRWGLPFWLAVPAATVITGAFALLVGVPALRIQGLFLAATTFAFAVATSTVLFSRDYFGWLLPTVVRRPSFFLIDFEDERSMYFLCVGCLGLAILLALNLRRSRFGRVLIGVRDNENNAASQGLSPVRAKLSAFAVAGALAGFAGAVFAFQQRGVSADSFSATASFNIFVQVVFGGVGTIGGALLGSAYLNGTAYFLGSNPLLVTIVGPIGTLFLLFLEPGGLVAMLTRVRDAGLRIIAQRNQLVVPSLFADVDPEALALRLAPLSPRSEGSGLDAVRRRYKVGGSRLAKHGVLVGDPGAASREGAAIDAAGREQPETAPLEPPQAAVL